MKLFECFAAAGFHTCVATTFDLSFEAWEAMALPRLREASCNNNIVVADPRMVALRLANGAGLPKYAGKRYSVVDALIPGNGVFHSKMILQLGRDTGRLIVGSANLTAPGLAGNLEIVGEVVVTEADKSAVPVLRAAMANIALAVGATAQTARQQIDWAVEKTPWLKHGPDSREAIPNTNGGLTSLLLSGEDVGIAEKFRALVGGEKVRRLVVMSPYWDNDLSALKWLQAKLKPASTSVLIQPSSRLFPTHALTARSEFEFYNIANLRRAEARFPHAKLFIAQTSKADHVLYGSSNCTRAALGDGHFPGSNGEASLYRRMSPGMAVQNLELDGVLKPEASISLFDLPKFERGEDVPLAEVQERLAGRFEVRSGALRWWPKPAFDYDDAVVDLFDQRLALIHSGSAQASANGFRTIAMPDQTRPAFAVVRAGAGQSALTVVTLDVDIYANQQRAKSARIRNALEHFADEEASEGLWLLEVMDAIHSAETEEASAGAERSKGPRRSESVDTRAHRTLPYEEFVRARPPSGRTSPVEESTMSTSYVDAVRSALNFFLGRGSKPAQEEDAKDSAEKILDMGDETSDGEEDIESGVDANTQRKGQGNIEAAQKRAIQRRRKYYKDTAKKIVKAVTSFEEAMREKGLREGLAGVDLLRLRALLMIVLTAGTNRIVVVPPDADKPMSRVQVLPIQGEDGWPRLVMRLLFEYFFRPPSLLSRTYVPLTETGGLPVDVSECLATCYWAACAIDTAADQQGAPRNPTWSVAKSLYRVIALDKDRASSETVTSMMKALTQRLASRLGVANERTLFAAHRSAVRVGDRQFRLNALRSDP